MKLSPIWIDGTRKLREIRESGLSDEAKLHLLQATVLFGINLFDRNAQVLSGALWIDYIHKQGAGWLLSTGESKTYNDRATFECGGHHVSLDFLRKVNIASLCAPFCAPSSTVVEIGAGFGQLARIMLLGKLCKKYVIVDLPESLYFAKLFLDREVPGADVEYIAADDFDGWVAKNGKNDCFVNTQSLGEMKAEVARNYVQKMQKVSKAIVLMNRMLNTYHPWRDGYRDSDSGWYWELDNEWETSRVELAPEFTRWQYETMMHSRELLFMGRRSAPHCGSSGEAYRHYQCFKRNRESANSRESNQFIDRDMAAAMLEQVRIRPQDRTALDLLIRYLRIVELKFPFEEQAYLFKRWRQLCGNRHPLESSKAVRILRKVFGTVWLQSYIMARRFGIAPTQEIERQVLDTGV